jgi:hypothetical protein
MLTTVEQAKGHRVLALQQRPAGLKGVPAGSAARAASAAFPDVREETFIVYREALPQLQSKPLGQTT